MKKLILFTLLFAATMSLQAQFTKVTIKQIQEVPFDSLKVVDSVGFLVSPIWTKQASPLLGQKVEVTALVTIQPYIVTYTGGGRTIALSDTGIAASQPWTGTFSRYGGSAASFDANARRRHRSLGSFIGEVSAIALGDHE